MIRHALPIQRAQLPPRRRGSLAGFGQDEESSGIMDATSLLGGDQRLAFLLDTQAHYGFSPTEIVEGGQLMTMYVELPNPGDNRFEGGRGNDSFDGGFGNDRIDGNNKSATISSRVVSAMTRSTVAGVSTVCWVALGKTASPAGRAMFGSRATRAPTT
jgi:hypothetical protein